MKIQEEPLVNSSIILPDDVKHVKEQLQKTSKKLKKIIIICAIASVILLGLALFFLIRQIVDSEAETLKITNNQLASQNEQLNSANAKMETDIQALVDNMVTLNTTISKLNNQINATNQQIIGLQTYIDLNCDVYNQNLRLNDTNINAFVMAVPGSANSKQPTPYITDLNLSNNKLTQLCGNSLPDLLAIDLSNNPIVNISNNRLNSLQNFRLNQVPTLLQFNGNHLPVLTQLDLSNNHLTSFQNNYFPQIQSIKLYKNQLNEISNYSLFSLSSLEILGNPIKIFKYNKFPVLTELSGMENVYLNTVTGNYFGGLQKLALHCAVNQMLTFQANSLPNLSSLIVDGCVWDYAKLKTNDFQIFSSLYVKNSKITNFQFFPQLIQLKECQLISTDIQSFTSHNYPNMTNLYLQDNIQLNLFENNTFLRLENLFISRSNKLQSICKNNMTSLKNFQANSLGLTDLTCFSNIKSLETIDVFNHNISNLSNFSLPKLTDLVMRGGVVQTFKNNSLPSLVHLEIQLNSPDIDVSSFQNTLEVLSLEGQLASFSNYNLPALQKLTFASRNDIDFKQNNFSKLTQLYLKWISPKSLDQNIFGPIERLDLVACQSQQFTLSTKYDNTLKYLTILSSNIRTFSYRQLPNLSNLVIFNSTLQFFLINKLRSIKQIDLSNNNLFSFDCYGISTVQILNLSYNKLTDDIATTLLSCDFTKLKYLDLRNNSINSTQVYSRLSEKFKETVIEI